MGSEIRIDARGMPEEEYRKLPYLLKWLKVVMMEDVGDLRMVEEGEPADILLVDIERARLTEQVGPGEAGGVREIAVAEDASRLSAPDEGLTYPLRVGDLQRWLERAVAESPPPSAELAAASDDTGEGAGDAGASPDAGPGAANVDRLVVPLLDSQPASDLHLDGVEGVEVVVRPEQGYWSPLYPASFARLQTAIRHGQWSPVAKAEEGDVGGWKPLTRLVWLLAYFGARDGLLPRIPRDRVFALETWPDFTVIPMEANNLRVWAYLKWHAADAETIAEATGVDRGQVLGALNAGYLCGYVRLSEGSESPRRARTDEGNNLLGRIRQRLGLPSGHQPRRSET